MRILLIATALALSLLGSTPGAVELPDVALPSAPLPDATALADPPATPAAPALPLPDLPTDVAPPLDIEPLALPDSSAPKGPAWPFDAPIVLPPPEAVAASAVVGGALALVGFALYSRLARHEILDHERREEMMALVRACPGIPLTEIAKRTGLGWGTAVYHLDRLEREGFVTSERASGRRCYFAVGAVAKEARAPLGALQQETTRTVAAYVVGRPGATQGELAEALGMTASAASKQVSKLENVGLVRREREWKTVRLHPQPRLAELLVPARAATS